MGYNPSQIENLPEDVLLHILQSLPLIDAVATRPLSRRWKMIWEKSCSQRLNFCFDIDNLIGIQYPIPETILGLEYRKRMLLHDKRYYGLSSQIIEDFIKGVDMILQCHRDGGVLQGVNSLEIRFLLRGKHSNHINNWISSTVTSMTKQLTLVFDLPSDVKCPLYPMSYTESELYELPLEALLNQKKISLEYLQLEFISVKLPQSFDCFATLRTLKLNLIDLTQEDVHKLLIGCSVLEYLKIQGCQNLVALQVSSPLPHLKVLVLRKCRQLRSLELCAENLSSLDCDEVLSMDHVMLRGCHNLTQVASCAENDVDRDHLRQLSTDFPLMTTFHLESCPEVMNAVLGGNIFAHLKFLAIFTYIERYDKFQCLSSSLNVVAPMLEEFELHAPDADLEGGYKVKKKRNFNGEPHNHLKRVTFTAFSGSKIQVTLAKYFLQKAPKLQTMTMDPVVRGYGNFDAIERVGYTRDPCGQCIKAYQILSKEAPENAKLILVGYN